MKDKKELGNEPIIVDLSDFLHHMKSYIYVIILCVLLGGFGGAFYLWKIEVPLYQTSSMVYMRDSATTLSVSDLQLSSALSSDYSVILMSRPILETVINDLNLDMIYEQLYGKIYISNIADTRILRITVTDEDPKRAADIANRLAEYGITSIEEIESKSPYMVERAVVKTNKINMSSSKVITIGAALGFVASIFGLFAMYILDDKVRTAEELERILDVPVLVGINESKILMKTDNYWTKKRRKK